MGGRGFFSEEAVEQRGAPWLKMGVGRKSRLRQGFRSAALATA